MENLKSKQEIDSICKKYGIKNYSINIDGSIDVDGDINLSYKELTKIPLKFGKVSGDFHCDGNLLESLEGCPTSVGGGFFCYENQLESLEGCPKSVGGDFFCSNNQLESLEGCPKSVGLDFYCHGNQLKNLEGCPKSVSRGFYCQNNQLTDFTGFIEFFEGRVNFIGNPVQEILDLFPEERQNKVIYWINEFEVIGGNKVSLGRLEEVFYRLKIDRDIEDIKFKNYLMT